jgi:hypothetical protein
MVASVTDLLWPVRRPKPEGIEEIAARIAAGNPPPAGEIMAVLDRTRCSDADLQAAVDRHRRTAELRQVIADAAPARKRFATLAAEVQAATAAVAKATAARDAVMARIGDDYRDLGYAVEAADRAEAALLDRDNLPAALAAQLTEAERVAGEASEAAVAARAELATCRRSLQDAEGRLPMAEHEADLNPGNADIEAAAARARSAVKLRGERLKAAEVALRLAEADEADANQRQADTLAAIRKAVLG